MNFEQIKDKIKNVNKKNIAIVIIILLIGIVCIWGGVEYYNFNKFKTEKMRSEEMIPLDLTGQPIRPSQYNIGIEYKEAMKGKKPVLVLFYADWCGYCIRFMPIYKELSVKYADDVEFSKVNVEDKKHEKLVNTIGITGFPTVFILDPKYDNKVLLSNAYLSSVDKVSTEIDRYLRIRKILDKK